MRTERFRDRREAGRLLGEALAARGGSQVLVLALPRGGVPVGYEVAARLGAALDVLVVRKLGVPGHEEFAMGAIAPGGVRVLDRALLGELGSSAVALEGVVAREQRELERRERAYRGDRPPPDVRGRTGIVVDDGLATGATMRAAVQALRAMGVARLRVAVPVGPASTCAALRGEVDDVVCLRMPEPFHAVGLWYEDFPQTGDDEVRGLLAKVLHRDAS